MKKIKGFTLVELIVVIAIFLILLVVATTLLQPINALYVSTYKYANSVAVVDNVSMYLEDNMRSANRVDIFDHVSYTDTDAEKAFIQTRVSEFVNRYHINDPKKISQTVNGEIVYVLKINNPEIADLDADVIDKKWANSGQISVWQYNPQNVAQVNLATDTAKASDAATAEIASAAKLWAVNQLFYEDYTFTANLGAYNEETGNFETRGNTFCMNVNIYTNDRVRGELQQLTNTNLDNAVSFSLNNVASGTGAREEEMYAYKAETYTDDTGSPATRYVAELIGTVPRYRYTDCRADANAGNDIYVLFTQCPEIENQ